MARRGNNRKVLAVNLQMQNMMCAMFQYVSLLNIHRVIDEVSYIQIAKTEARTCRRTRKGGGADPAPSFDQGYRPRDQDMRERSRLLHG